MYFGDLFRKKLDVKFNVFEKLKYNCFEHVGLLFFFELKKN